VNRNVRLRPLEPKEYKPISDLLADGLTYHQIVDEVKKRLGTSIKTCPYCTGKKGDWNRNAWGLEYW
jgi:hypothetical protein